MDEYERRELEDEVGGALGDPRRCKRHGEVISSPDGQFDAPCGRCEAEQDQDRAIDLPRGALVVAIRVVDPEGANAQVGEAGVVFEPTNHYGDGNGPMVRWFSGGACNVYEGDVRVWIL